MFERKGDFAMEVDFVRGNFGQHFFEGSLGDSVAVESQAEGAVSGVVFQTI